MRDRNPNCTFSPCGEKAGMRAGGGRKLASLDFKHDEVRLPRAFAGLDSNSQNPHPSLLPEGEGVIPNAPSTVVSLDSCFRPPPVLAGPVMIGKNGIRAARCLRR